MEPDPLEQALADYAREHPPACPDRLQSDIWREIGLRRRSMWARLFPLAEWRSLFRNPRMALPAVALALAIGILPGLLFATRGSDQRLASESFHFDVFSSKAPLAVLERSTLNSANIQP
jgi:hypothetical protein